METLANLAKPQGDVFEVLSKRGSTVNKPSKTMCSSMESDTGVTSKLDDPLKVNDAVGRLNSTNSSAL